MSDVPGLAARHRVPGDPYAIPVELDLGELRGVFLIGDGVAFASVEAVGRVPARSLVDELLASGLGDPGATRDPRVPLLTVQVSDDASEHFDPALSIREAIELRIGRDGGLELDVEFVGADPALTGPRWRAMEDVLDECGDAWGLPLVSVINDPGGSLAEVWNARFRVPDLDVPVRLLVERARRLVRAAEFRPRDGEGLDELLAVLRAGDAHALVGLEEGPVLQALPAPDGDENLRDLARHVAGFANGLHGGTIVLGAAARRMPDDRRRVVASVTPFSVVGTAEAAGTAIAAAVFPPPDGLVVEVVPVAEAAPGDGLVVVTVPPQQRGLKPFLVHGERAADWGTSRTVEIPVREHEELRFEHVAALHGAIAAGRVLLSGPLR